MKMASSVDEFFEWQKTWAPILTPIREILLSTELEESLKWGIPTYTLGGKNVLGLAGFKSHAALWFFQGSFLVDSDGVLVNAQEGKTKGQRQWRFTLEDKLNKPLIRQYILEAIQNQKEGKEIKKDRSKPVVIPPELQSAFASSPSLHSAFEALTKGKQREYAEYITEAKREATKVKRLEKIAPMIEAGVGLNDKYK